MKNCDALYINGAWVASASGKFIDVINATTEEVMGRVPEGTEGDANSAIAAARAAFDGWSQTPAAKRGEYLAAIAAKLKERSDELAKTITGEVGVPFKLSQRMMVGMPVNTVSIYVRGCAARPTSDERPLENVGQSGLDEFAAGRQGAT